MPDLSTKQAATRLQVSLRTLQRYLKQGHFPNAYRLPNRHIRIPSHDIDSYLQQHVIPPTTASDKQTTKDDKSRQDHDTTTTSYDKTTTVYDTDMTALTKPFPKFAFEFETRILRIRYYRYVGEQSILGDGIERLLTLLRKHYEKVKKRFSRR